LPKSAILSEKNSVNDKQVELIEWVEVTAPCGQSGRVGVAELSGYVQVTIMNTFLKRNLV